MVRTPYNNITQTIQYTKYESKTQTNAKHMQLNLIQNYKGSHNPKGTTSKTIILQPIGFEIALGFNNKIETSENRTIEIRLLPHPILDLTSTLGSPKWSRFTSSPKSLQHEEKSLLLTTCDNARERKHNKSST